MAIDVNELLAAIPGDDPAGADASFSDEFDRIREARRADDPSLAQGEWQTELKQADWREAERISEKILRETSKDLQVAAWLGEALIAQHGLDGARDAFDVMAGLLDTYWDGLHPRIEDDDLDERAGKLAWFANYGSQALATWPLNADSQNPLSLTGWLDSREVDNLGRQNAEAYQAAMDDGRINGEAFDSQMLAIPEAMVIERIEQAQAVRLAFDRFSQMSDQKLGRDAPSLAAIDEALKRIAQVYARLGTSKGLNLSADAGAIAEEPGAAGFNAAAGPAAGGVSISLGAGSHASKDAALNALREIAGFFRRTEPHSPVPYLLDRAVAWANMPLETWLAELIRDESMLGSIRERVGLDAYSGD